MNACWALRPGLGPVRRARQSQALVPRGTAQARRIRSRTMTAGSWGPARGSRWITPLNGSSFDSRGGQRNAGGASDRSACGTVVCDAHQDQVGRASARRTAYASGCFLARGFATIAAECGTGGLAGAAALADVSRSDSATHMSRSAARQSDETAFRRVGLPSFPPHTSWPEARLHPRRRSSSISKERAT
jgi:hypothetical protein